MCPDHSQPPYSPLWMVGRDLRLKAVACVTPDTESKWAK